MKQPERNLQKACVTWFRLQYPSYIIHHSPNGGKRDSRISRIGKRYSPTGTILQSMGTLKGYPDLTIIAPGKIFFVELKAGKTDLSEHQKAFMLKVNSFGFSCYCVNNIEDFVSVVKSEL